MGTEFDETSSDAFLGGEILDQALSCNDKERMMVARHWRGWTKSVDGDAYERLLADKVAPSLEVIEGYRGGYVLRNDGGEESEFVVVNFFESMQAVKRFAGEDYATPVFEPEARKLLSRIEPVAHHYEVRAHIKGQGILR